MRYNKNVNKVESIVGHLKRELELVEAIEKEVKSCGATLSENQNRKIELLKELIKSYGEEVIE